MSKIKTAKGTYIEDITGQIFHRLKVLELTDKKNNDNRWIWKCECLCDKHTIVYTDMHHLRSGNTKSCGCLQKEKVIAKNLKGKIDLTGQRFGLLTVIEEDKELEEKRQDGISYWKCLCDCGKETTVALGELRRSFYKDDKRKGTQSCGCSSKSVGENKLKELFLKYHINFDREKSFANCFNPQTKGKLRFDFYLPQQNCCIEYDGYTHFEANGGWNTEENLKNLQFRDNIKNQFCKENNIQLIRIPYWDYNKINKEYLQERGVIFE